MDVLADLADEWLLTLGSISPESRVVYGRSVRQFREYVDRSTDTADASLLILVAVDIGMVVLVRTLERRRGSRAGHVPAAAHRRV